MPNPEQAPPVRWHSLSLRLSAAFVTVLVTAAFAVGYLFDRGRAEAVEKHAIEQLRLHAERGADEVARLIGQLQRDVLFLAGTPPIQGIRRALEAGGTDTAGGSSLGQWKERLQQIFLSFGESRPEYFQLRFIGASDNGLELVRVERTENGLRATPPEALQHKGDRYYVREASRLTPGSVYLSRIDLNQEHGQLGVPHLPTLRAAIPVRNPAGGLVGLVVINMDMGWAFQRAQSFGDAAESVSVTDASGDFLLHPEPGRAFGVELGTPFRLADAFPGDAERIAATLAKGGGLLDVQGPQGELAAFLAIRAWDPTHPDRRLAYIVTAPMGYVMRDGTSLRRQSLAGMGGLLALAIAVIVLMVRRNTRSLIALANASKAIAGGNYRIALPETDGNEVGVLAVAFGRMAQEVERREEALAELNRKLERRVEDRTAELARQHALQQSILENIADGVVVADRDGHFLLWNRKAEQIVGSCPDEVKPENWSTHFGLFRDEEGDPIPTAELPLVRAIQGEPCDNVEMYLRNPQSDEGRWVQVTARPLLGPDGAIAGGVAVLVDVTEHRLLRKREASHRAKLAKVGRLAMRAEIASSAAHQLSQPIAAMNNYAGAAVRLHEQGRLGEGELLEFLKRIEILAREAGEILHKLRALIRRRSPPLVPVDINQVADSCLDFLSERIRHQGIRIERRYGQDLPKPLGDPIELEHVLIQLVSNALEAMGGISRPEHCLSIATDHDPAAALVAIEVADTGPGVSQELADRLFDPWQTDKPDALGIGLSVAQSIIEMRRGNIRMQRGDLGGALFRVELPVSREDPV